MSRKQIQLIVPLLALAILAGAVPALADESEGFFVFGSAGSTRPNNLRHLYAAIEDANEQGEAIILDPDSEVSWRAGVGYGWGDRGAIRVSFWNYDLSDSLDGTLPAYSNINDSFLGGYAGGYSTAYDFEGKSEVDASSVDVEYVRSHSITDNWKWNTTLGLRRVEFEEEMSFTVENNRITDARTIDMDAIGAKFGVGTSFKAWERVAFVGGAALSFLSGDTDQEASEAPDDNDTRSLSEDISGTILDVEVGVDIDLGKWVDLAVLWTHSNWSKLVTNRIFGADDLDDVLFEDRDDVSFDSLGVMVQVNFGGK